MVGPWNLFRFVTVGIVSGLILTGVFKSFAQITAVPGISNSQKLGHSVILSGTGNTKHFFWIEDSSAGIRNIYYKKTINHIWQNQKTLLYTYTGSVTDSIHGISCIMLPTGKMVAVFRTDNHYVIYSDDGGNNWSQPQILPTGVSGLSRRLSLQGQLSPDGTGALFYTYIRSGNAYYIKSTDGGITWQQEAVLLSGISNITAATLLELSPALHVAAVYSPDTPGSVFIYKSTDGWLAWSLVHTVSAGAAYISGITFNRVQGSSFFNLFYSGTFSTPLPGIFQKDIYRIEINAALTGFSAPQKSTYFMGDDRFMSLSGSDSLFTFISKRDSLSEKIFYLNVLAAHDEPSPPVFYGTSEEYPGSGGVLFKSKILDYDSMTVILEYLLNSGSIQTAQCNDNGIMGDSVAGDYIYSCQLPQPRPGDYIQYRIKASDARGNITYTKWKHIFVPIGPLSQLITVSSGEFTLESDIYGSIGRLQTNGQGGRFQGKVILWNSGFNLTGKAGSQYWGAGSVDHQNQRDFLPGTRNSVPGDPRSTIFMINSSDAPFGSSWQQYKFAVETGAPFHDGNGDGIYNPVDLNNNGLWDNNEDAPVLLGDSHSYLVMNDAQPAHLRRYSDTSPIGVEVRQQIISRQQTSPGLDEIFFVRYTLTNKSNHSVFDSVYFSINTDPDLGNYQDDLSGSDTLLRGGYVYNSGPDNQFDGTAPAFIQTFITTPYSYIPGVTYTDNNANGLYDEGIDTPLDSIVLNYGPRTGQKWVRGAAASRFSSFNQFNVFPLTMIPNDLQEMRNMQMGGKNMNGTPLNPCTWPYGNASNLPDCGSIDPRYVYSGNPLNGTGWLNTLGTDQSYLISAGPFRMEKDKPVDFIVGYSAAISTTPLLSVLKAKQAAGNAANIYHSNFTQFTSVEDNGLTAPAGFTLEQNYPNPFNPVTTIRYHLPEKGMVRMTIFDPLGRQIKILLNELKEAGSHQLLFDAVALSSGIYFYHLQINGLEQVKKMVVMK